jgi:exopolysaccharide/PEP-CTERM locus tyrosine autokinase
MSIFERAMQKMQNSPAVKSVGPGSPEPGRVVPPALARAGAQAPTHIEPASVPHGRRVTIDRDALLADGLLAPPLVERQIVEQLRQIRRPLIANAFRRGVPKVEMGQLIMLASAVPGEGKTFISLNLSLSIARQNDIRVLLVDADVRKGHISKMLGLTESPGLLDLLRNPGLDPESLIASTDVPGFSVLPAGGHPENATELFASSNMLSTMRRIVDRDAGRLVLLDSSPLLRTTESQILADVAGQIVVVVRAGDTARSILLDALSYLADRPIVSLVLNQSTSDAPTGYYYYGHGNSAAARPDT